ncbi:d0b2a38b-8161-436b-bc96-16baac3e1365 [Thermothielavioides terrestris]|uniref:D0b2a38b-8161-436b-bc96-16baac3e1365 n=1 Tax=Thermothielavioides terrestris TaxID=2587410 RepID=A0A3S4ET40_9PEZI|nr:d0b2a38b-8161-436b-bc96-16baac3e1365 [Thermothielavioides terrestris]
MPAIDVAMERSLRRGFLDLLVGSLRPAFGRRDITGEISDVKTAFSSWDNCIQVNYCKWPVIALIIIGGLIIISVVWCIIRRRKYLDEPYIPPHHGYKSQEPMHAGFPGATIPTVNKAADFPQYAEFDVGGKKNEDALPQMPTWENAESKKVLVEEEAVEMNALKKPEAGEQAGSRGAGAGATGGAVAGATSPTGSRSPVNRSPYGPPGPGSGSNGYFGVTQSDPYAPGAPAYNQPGAAYGEAEQGYGRRSPHAYHNGGYDDGYNNGGYGQAHDHADGYGAAHQQPYDAYDHYSSPANQGYGIARHQTPTRGMDSGPYGPDARRSPVPQGALAGYGVEARRSPAPQGSYGSAYGAEARRSPAPQGGDYAAARRSPAPQGGDYAAARRSPAPQAGGYGSNSGAGRYGAARESPQRQYSSHNDPVSSPTGPAGLTPLRNDAGFDFTSGYSRPPAAAAAPNSPGGYRQPSPALEGRGSQGAGAGGYPGYKPYQPPA